MWTYSAWTGKHTLSFILQLCANALEPSIFSRCRFFMKARGSFQSFMSASSSSVRPKAGEWSKSVSIFISALWRKEQVDKVGTVGRVYAPACYVMFTKVCDTLCFVWTENDLSLLMSVSFSQFLFLSSVRKDCSLFWCKKTHRSRSVSLHQLLKWNWRGHTSVASLNNLLCFSAPCMQFKSAFKLFF